MILQSYKINAIKARQILSQSLHNITFFCFKYAECFELAFIYIFSYAVINNRAVSMKPVTMVSMRKTSLLDPQDEIT